MPTWPASLPQSVLADVSRKRQSGMIRSQMDTGAAKQRKRFTAVVRQYQASMILTGAQLATFDSFYESDLGQGATSFTWIDPVTDASCSLRFMADPEVSMVKPSATVNNRLWRVTMQLERLP